MRLLVYLRLGSDGRKIYAAASTKPDDRPFTKPGQGSLIPTVFTALEIEIPDEVFQPSFHRIRLDIPVQAVQAVATTEHPQRHLKAHDDGITVGSQVKQVYGTGATDAVGTAIEITRTMVKVEFPDGVRALPRHWLAVQAKVEVVK